STPDGYGCRRSSDSLLGTELPLTPPSPLRGRGSATTGGPPMPKPIGRSSVTTTSPRVTTPRSAPASTVKYPKLDARIDAAKSKLYLNLVDLHDADVMEHLKAASKRGVDVHVVLTPKGPMPMADRLHLLDLEGAGVDVVAGKKSPGLDNNAGLVDGKA